MNRMEKKKIRIGDLSESLGVEKFVIRFWEKEFSIRAHRTEGGQRYYSEKDLKKFEMIKDLLYNQGFTIAGAKKHMRSLKKGSSQEEKIIASQVTTLDEAPSEETHPLTQELPADISQQIIDLQRKLLKLRELL